MTPEQKQRIEQIERWSRIAHDMAETAIKNRISPGESQNEKKLRDDIDFLLSLVKSQEAERDHEAERVAIAGIQEGLRQRDELAANRMRSACVAKLRQIAADYDNVAQPNTGAAISKQALLYGARQLESVSIQEQEAKDDPNP